MSSAERYKELVRRSNEEVWAQGKLDVLDEYVAADYIEHNTAMPEPIRGPAGYKRNVRKVREAFPDLSVRTDDLIGEGNRVVTRFTLTGTHENEFMGIEPTGESVEIQGISIGSFDDGTLVEGWTNVDVMGLMQQLGAVEPPDV